MSYGSFPVISSSPDRWVSERDKVIATKDSLAFSEYFADNGLKTSYLLVCVDLGGVCEWSWGTMAARNTPVDDQSTSVEFVSTMTRGVRDCGFA